MSAEVVDDLRRRLTSYARLVRHDGYLNVEALLGQIEDVTEDAQRWRNAEAAGHVVKFSASGFGLQHPPSCRPNLIGCRFNRHLSAQAAPAMRPGTYRMTWDSDAPKYVRVVALSETPR